MKFQAFAFVFHPLSSIFPSLIRTRLENTLFCHAYWLEPRLTTKGEGSFRNDSLILLHSSVPMEQKQRPMAVSEFRSGPRMTNTRTYHRWERSELGTTTWANREKKIADGSQKWTGNGKGYLQLPLRVDDANHRWDYLQAHSLYINDRWGKVIHG